jgi:hypothetical protein
MRLSGDGLALTVEAINDDNAVMAHGRSKEESGHSIAKPLTISR